MAWLSWAIPTALSAFGLYQQSQQASDARKAADEARDSTKALTARQVKLFDKMYGDVTKADLAGQFDPGHRIAQATRDAGVFESLDLRNAAAAGKAAGFRAGDTPVLQQLGDIRSGYLSKYQQLTDSIRQNSFAQKQAAYAAVNPQGLNTAIQSEGNNLAMARSDLAASNQSTMALLGSLQGTLGGALLKPGDKKTPPIYDLPVNNTSGGLSKWGALSNIKLYG
jgi:hypothetical protein